MFEKQDGNITHNRFRNAHQRRHTWQQRLLFVGGIGFGVAVERSESCR